MAINKKKSRKINVNGIDYRWTLARRPSDLGKGYPSPKLSEIQCRKIIIELRDQPKSQARIIYFYEAIYELGEEIIPKVGIKPNLIESIIKESIQKGWDPTSKSHIEYIKFEEGLEHINPEKEPENGE